MQGTGLIHRFLYFSLTRIVAGVVVVAGTVILTQAGAETLFDLLSLERSVKRLFVGLLTALVSIGSYVLLIRHYEKREISELSLDGLATNLLSGALLGALLQSLTILVIYLAGAFTIRDVNPFIFLLPALTMAFTSAIFEEVLVRGVIFRIMEEKLGSYIALFLSALIFGAMHLGNPNSSLLAASGLALQAGLFLAAAYMYSRNLWFPIAIHFAWNFTQAGIFGATVSGNATRTSLLSTEVRGPDWITGGAFGPEGSLQATGFCLTATVVLMILNHRQNKIIKPSWVKERTITVAFTPETQHIPSKN